VIPLPRVAIAPCLPGLRQSGRSASAWRYAQPDINNEEMTMRKTVYQCNYDRLIKLGIVKDGQLRADGRSQSAGFMDLVFERLPYLDGFNGHACKAFSIAHYFTQNGDLCQDPEMVVVVYPDLAMAEAYSFQQAIPPLYQDVYPEPGKVRPKLKKELNSFLRQWLQNLLDQDHGDTWIDN
jgi:hypothetical protein